MLAINIPADGLFLAVQNKANGNFSKENCERIINAYIGRFLEAEPDVIMLNVCYRRTLTPSEVFDSYLYDVATDSEGLALRNEKGETQKSFSPVTEGLSKYFMSFILCARALLRGGIDVYKIAIERIRKTSCRVFLSVRMNDGHYTDNPAVNSSFATKNGAVNTIKKDGEYLDFSLASVQNYYYAYIEELLCAYAPDGIEMDWLRFPTVLPDEKRADLSIITGYMKKVRALLERHNPSPLLAVRMLPTEKENLNCGFDACGWIAEGVADILTIENFYIPTNFELPVSEWRGSIEKRNTAHHAYSLLCGADWGVSCVPGYHIAITPAHVRGFSETCLDQGADGVYLFNFFEENDTSAFELVADENGAHLENCFLERIKAAKHPKDLPRRYVYIGNSNQRYPILLAPREAYAFGRKLNGPFFGCKVLIGCEKDAPISVFVNGSAVSSVEKQPVFEGFEFIPKSEIGKKSHFIYALTQAAPFVCAAVLPAGLLESAPLHIKIRNDSEKPLEILWLEILCE